MNRPEGFDERVLAYLPMMKRMASRLVPPQDREDLVQSAVATALRKCGRERDGFASWLRFIVLSEYRNYKAARTLSPANDNDQPSTQEEIVACHQALAKCRHPQITLAAAQGWTLDEIGEQLGISKQAVGIKIKDDRTRMAA